MEPPSDTNTSKYEHLRFHVKSARWKTFKDAFCKEETVHEENIDNACSPEQLNDAVETLTAFIQKCAKLSMKINNGNSVKNDKVRWWDTELREIRNRTRAFRRKWQKCQNRERKIELGLHYRKELKLFKAAMNKKKKASWEELCAEIKIANAFSLPYKIAKKKNHKPLELAVTMIKGKQIQSVDDSLREIVDSLFPDDTNVEDDKDQSDIRKASCRRSDTVNDPPFTMVELREVLTKIASGKAPGLDGISTEIIVHIFRNHPGLLLKLFNKCFSLCCFPTSWKEAKLVLFNKVGKDSSNPTSFRPICLLSCLGKVFEKLLLNRILYHISKGNSIDTQQYGFLPGRSTIHALENLRSVIVRNRENGEYSLTIFLDIKNAFNSIWWPTVLNFCIDNKLPNNITEVIRDFLRKRRVIVTTNNSSIAKNLSMGCPQGSIQGPIMWNMTINPLFNIIRDEFTEIQAFADDVVLIIRGKSRKDLEDRGNAALDRAVKWSKDYKLKFDPSKTKGMVFGAREYNSRKKFRQLSHNRPPTIKMEGRSIKFEKSVKYLGVIFSNNLSWVDHVKYIKEKVSNICLELNRMTSARGGLNPSVLKKIYKGGIERFMTYGCNIWFQERSAIIKHLRMAQRLPALLISKAYRTTALESLLVLSGLEPIELVIRRERVVSSLFQLNTPCNVDGNNFVQNDFEKPLNIYETPPSKWFALEWSPESAANHSLDIFTDGSKIENLVGAAFCVVEGNAIIHKEKFQLRPQNSVFQAELLAIRSAACWAATSGRGRSVAIISDSRSALEALKDPAQRNELAITTKNAVLGASRFSDVGLFWTKAHIGTWGNESADLLAKSAAKNESNDSIPVYLPWPRSYLRYLTKKLLISDWKESWRTSNKGRHLFNYIKEPSSNFTSPSPSFSRLTSGHIRSPAYLARFGILQSPTCYCGSEGNVEHYLTSCPILEEERKGFSRIYNSNEDLEKLIKNKKDLYLAIKIINLVGENLEDFLPPEDWN